MQRNEVPVILLDSRPTFSITINADAAAAALADVL